jgi:4-hydroxybenzoate polyprenyltransferase
MPSELVSVQLVNAIKHVRFGFSLMLMPAFLLSVAMIGHINPDIVALFGILHLLIYPASNGYNSFFDRDTGAIGGLAVPPPVNRYLPMLVQSFDVLALGLTAILFVEILPAMVVYVFASRAYSYHKIRLKALPWLSFIMVGAFQGVLVYAMVDKLSNRPLFLWAEALVVFFYLLGSYPITQAYQIEEDISRGDSTVASVVGIKGSLLLTGLLFALYQGVCLWVGLPEVFILLGCGFPVVVVFFWGCFRYVRHGEMGYPFVRLLIICNMVSIFLYFAYCLSQGHIAYYHM